MNKIENLLADFWPRAMAFEEQIKRVVVGQDQAIRLLTVAVLARGHVLLEGGVGVGKTTLLRAAARALGGDYERIEGTIDLMPADLVYYTFLDENGKPGVSAGPLLRKGERLAVFFFNEINRARPQVHSLLLRVMAERSATAFNREYTFPNLLVFADRNRVEKEETFELPAAARDRFLLEIPINAPSDPEIQDQLTFEPRFHDPETLLRAIEPGVLSVTDLSRLAAGIQDQIVASATLRAYVRELSRACWDPDAFGIRLRDIDMGDLIESGPSPRGMSLLVRAAKVWAWLNRRDHLRPEDVQAVFAPTIGHRVFLKPVYEYRRAELVPELIERILRTVPAP